MANDSVLASEVYNPSREPAVQELFGLMTAEEPSQEVLDNYKLMVTSMSSANPFRGVLSNPRACEVDQANTDLDEIIDQVDKDPNYTDDIKDTLEDAKDVLDEYKEHTDRLIANFPTISSIVQNEIGNAGSIRDSNPCAGFGDIMGSILQAGQNIMNEILAALADVKGNLGKIQDLIRDAINRLMAAIAKAKAQLQEEIEKIAKAMLNMQKMNLAQMMKYQIQDPCLKAILSGMFSSAAANTLGVNK